MSARTGVRSPCGKCWAGVGAGAVPDRLATDRQGWTRRWRGDRQPGFLTTGGVNRKSGLRQNGARRRQGVDSGPRKRGCPGRHSAASLSWRYRRHQGVGGPRANRAEVMSRRSHDQAVSRRIGRRHFGQRGARVGAGSGSGGAGSSVGGCQAARSAGERIGAWFKRARTRLSLTRAAGCNQPKRRTRWKPAGRTC
jgi:hypothetical protein